MVTISPAGHQKHRYGLRRRREPCEGNGKAILRQQRNKLIFHFRRLWR